MAKTTPYPPRTGIAHQPTGTDLWRCIRRVTPTNHTAGPLVAIWSQPHDNLEYKKAGKESEDKFQPVDKNY